MCGRYTLRSTDRIRIKLAAANQLELDDIVPRFNIAPGQTVLAILNLEQQTFADLLLWGLVPSWSAEPKGFINARAETLAEKPSFSESFQRRRCLIPADGFYEWKRTGRARQAFFFEMKDEAPFAFAGVWDEWKKDGVLIKSCAIVTTGANELVEPIHDRMPVILAEESYKLWLDPRTPPSELKNLLLPFPGAAMKSHPVGSNVNYPTIDNDDLIRRVDAEPGTTRSLF
jgi:putative SOS response-associated peptidase YedK